MSSTLAGVLMVVHSCFVPSYLLSSKKDIVLHHRANIRDFMEEGGFGKISYTMINGEPSSSLRKYIKDNRVDILAIGSVARGFLDRQVIGSTTENILSNTPCDLLLVRS